MKKARTWVCLTLAAILALFTGGCLAEAAVLDRDNLTAGVR